MITDLIGRAPLWLVKLVIRGIIRRTQIAYNKVKPPKRWKIIKLPSHLELEKSAIKLNYGSYRLVIESIIDGMVNIKLSKKGEEIIDKYFSIIEKEFEQKGKKIPRQLVEPKIRHIFERQINFLQQGRYKLLSSYVNSFLRKKDFNEALNLVQYSERPSHFISSLKAR